MHNCIGVRERNLSTKHSNDDITVSFHRILTNENANFVAHSTIKSIRTTIIISISVGYAFNPNLCVICSLNLGDCTTANKRNADRKKNMYTHVI